LSKNAYIFISILSVIQSTARASSD